MGFFERYAKVDKAAMENGAEVDFGGGFIVTVRHTTSEKCNLERGKITKELKVKNRNRELTTEQQKKITYHVVAYGGLVGWRGGDAPEFSPETAIEIFKERPEFLEDVIEAMTSYETFREGLVEDAAGN